MIHQLDPTELAERLAAGERIILVDVREPWEHELARLDHSLLIPLGQLAQRTDEVERARQELPGAAPAMPAMPATPAMPAMIVAYCHHGVRSLTGASILVRAGLGDVYSLAGGIDAWSMIVDPKVPQY